VSGKDFISAEIEEDEFDGRRGALILIASHRALGLLGERGDKSDSVRDIHHWAYFPNALARMRFVEQAITRGFRLRRTTEPSPYNASFGAILIHKDTPTERLFEDVVTLLSELAAQSGGRYDGWETQVLA
jgi:hypothetical protein